MQSITQFYIALGDPDNAEPKAQLLTYNLPETELEQARQLLDQTAAARKEYVREESESQNATQQHKGNKWQSRHKCQKEQ